ERLHDRVVDTRPHLADALVVTLRVDAVGQEDDAHLALEVDPQRGAGEAEVADGGTRHARPRHRAGGRRRVPAARPGRVAHGRLARPELAHDLARPEPVLAAPAG